jgi:hypothetical protein
VARVVAKLEPFNPVSSDKDPEKYLEGGESGGHHHHDN